MTGPYLVIHEARGLGKLREQLELMGHFVEELFLQTGPACAR